MIGPVSVVAVVPAAGASSRFGSMKLLADVGGMPLVGRTIASLLAARVDRVVLVVAPDHRLAAVPGVADRRVTFVVNPDPSRGMFSSIQVGFTEAEADVVLVLPADMPFVAAGVIDRVIDACLATGSVVVPVHAGRRGHPVGIPRRYRSGLLSVRETSDLKSSLLAVVGSPPMEIEVDEPGILQDVDVPGDLGIRGRP
jgi:molybdenum cofactor cytidylyltransferase